MSEGRATESALRALRVIDERDVGSPTEFARLMWPDSHGWQVSIKCGPNGSHKGGAMPQSGGAYLAKLVRRGLLRERPAGKYRRAWELTDEGRRFLEAMPEGE